MRHINSTRLENWVGTEKLERVSTAMRNWYGNPIAMAGVPGGAWAAPGGDFVGHCDAGQSGSVQDWVEDSIRRRVRQVRAWLPRMARATRYRHGITNVGFASLSDLIAEASAGKRREFIFRKTGAGSTIGATDSLWRVGTLPPAGAAAAAAPGGTALTDATTGAHFFTNPTGGDTQHLVFAATACDIAGDNLMLYDRLFAVAKTMNSTATEAVTGVPTRYQSTTAGAQDSAENNFLFMECGTVLPATAHNWTVCTYLDQAAGASTLPSVAGNSANAAERLDLPLSSSWFAPLASGDRGVQTLTQMQCDALVATGTIDFVIGHTLAWFTHPLANALMYMDGINSAFNLVRIFDDAALALLIPQVGSTSTNTFTGSFTTVAG
jgi:hypothetical protein